MRTIKQVAALAVILFVVFLPSLALGLGQESVESAPTAEAPVVPGETVIVPEAPPPPGTDWTALVAVGSAYAFIIVELAKKNIPKLTGWWVFVAVLPAVAGVAIYQVGISDLKLLAKHAGLILLLTLGGRAGAYKLGAKALEAIRAAFSGQPVPDAPPFGPSSVTPSLAPPSSPFVETSVKQVSK